MLLAVVITGCHCFRYSLGNMLLAMAIWDVMLFSLFSGKHVVGHRFHGVPWLFSFFSGKHADGSGYH